MPPRCGSARLPHRPGEDGWSDLAYTVEGPVVDRIGAWFDELDDWASHPRAQFRAI